MPAPSCPQLFPVARGEPAFGFGRDASTIAASQVGASQVGASQWAGLGRGLTFVLLLAASLLGSVYVPQALHGPDWVEGTAAPATAR